MRDLGYFALERLKNIEEQEAFFVSRWKVDQDVFESKEATEPVNLAKLLERKMKKGRVDIIVFLGKERYQVRMVACLMDEKAIEQRRKEYSRVASRRGTSISKKKISLLKYSIFITNIPEEILSINAVMAIYRARWRVELIFKEWKSCLKLQYFRGYNEERLYCLLYGRLIMVLIIGAIRSTLIMYAFELDVELSSFKLTKYLIVDNTLLEVFKSGNFQKFIDDIIIDIPRRLSMDKRKRQSLRRNVKTNTSYYKPFEINEMNHEAA